MEKRRMRPAFKEKRKHTSGVQFILDMHSAESNVSWTRWMGTFILADIMFVWTLSCLLGANWQLEFALNDMPWGIVTIVGIVFGGKLGQAIADKVGTDPPIKGGK
jgi:uncharacterized integral membrane protein